MPGICLDLIIYGFYFFMDSSWIPLGIHLDLIRFLPFLFNSIWNLVEIQLDSILSFQFWWTCARSNWNPTGLLDSNWTMWGTIKYSIATVILYFSVISLQALILLYFNDMQSSYI
jgi:hypothetical protein